VTVSWWPTSVSTSTMSRRDGTPRSSLRGRQKILRVNELCDSFWTMRRSQRSAKACVH
jgi:hypothetical protein